MTDRPGNPSRPIGFARFFPKGNPALLAIIGDRIRQAGKITFADFMALALYHPEFGYYNASHERIGEQGDFTTSPATHPVFGALITHQLDQMWQCLGRPPRFDLIEMGAGPGNLCRDVLTYARSAYPEFSAALQYRIVESSADAIAKQKALLRESRLRLSEIRWYSSPSQLPARGLLGCFISNELVDAFPVHRVMNDGGQLKEAYVGLDEGELVDVPAEPSTPALAGYFQWVGASLPEGGQGEVNLQAVEWMKEVARRLKRGFVVTIDYGYPAAELYSAAHRRGTLLCYYRHTYTEDPYVRVGQQDITAHVDFTALAKAGEEEGLAPLPLCTQRDYLLTLGLPAFLAALERRGLPVTEYRANRLAMEELIKADDLGRLKVLLQSKGLKGFDPTSLPPLDPTNLNVPLLPTRKPPEFGRWGF